MNPSHLPIQPQQPHQEPPRPEEWNWPQFPKGAQRNYDRSFSTPFTGWEGDFLEAFSSTGIVLAACRKARVSDAIVRARRKSDPDFQRAFSEARDMAVETVEAAVLSRARDGVKRTRKHYYKGQVIQGSEETITEYSDSLAIFILKTWKPEVYRDQVDHNHRIKALHEEAERIAKETGLDKNELIAEAEKIMGLKG